ncbi:MAG: hypothetical protein Q7T80_19090 [Methanoregula sp.]|nr:hypothetical protein [Methanoregula sp.]
MDWADAHIDENLVAFHVSSSSPPAIKVYYADGTFYKSISLTNNAMKLDSLEISDGRVYYTEYNPAEPGYWRNETVYENTLATGQKQVIYRTDGPQQQVNKIVAEGDHVVMRGGSNNQDLILHTLSTGSNRVIFTSRNSIHGLSIDGDRILWGCERVDREPGREMHVYTISTGEDYIIPESKSIRTWGYGDISSDRVVWEMAAQEPDTSKGYPSLVNAGGDIRLMDLSTGKTRSVEILNTPSTPFISGDTVVYVKKPEINYNNSDTGTIRVYDIGTGKFSDVASEVAAISDFDNGLVVWNRLKPMSFWLTPVSGKIPSAVSPTTVTAETGTQRSAQQKPTPAESPVETVLIVLSVTVGVTVYAVQKKKSR